MKKPKQIYWCRQDDDGDMYYQHLTKGYYRTNCKYNIKGVCSEDGKPCKVFVYKPVKKIK